MSGMRDFILNVVPRSWAASMEAESREWMITCNNCGFSQSVWDLGGLRWKASGDKVVGRRCTNCGKVGGHTISKKAS